MNRQLHHNQSQYLHNQYQLAQLRDQYGQVLAQDLQMDTDF